MECTEPPPKLKRYNKGPKLHVSECIREFQLPANFPGLNSDPYKTIDVAKTSLKMIHDISSDTILNKTKDAKKSNSTKSLLKPIKKLEPVTTNSNNVNDTSTLKMLKLKSPDGKDLGEFQVKLLNLPDQSLKRKFITIPKSVVPVKNECQNSEISSQTEPRIDKVEQDVLNKAKIVTNISFNNLPSKDIQKIVEGKQMIENILSNPFESINTSKINNSEANSKKLMYIKTEDHPFFKNISPFGKQITLKPLKLKSFKGNPINLNSIDKNQNSETNFTNTGGLSGYKNGDLDAIDSRIEKKNSGTNSKNDQIPLTSETPKKSSTNPESKLLTSPKKEKEANSNEVVNSNNEIPTNSTTNESETEMDLDFDEEPPRPPKREWKKLPYTLTKNNVMIMLPKIPTKKLITNLPSPDSNSGSLILSDDDNYYQTSETNNDQDSDKPKRKNAKLKRKKNSSKKNNAEKKRRENPEESDMSIVEKALASVKDKSLREEALKIFATCKLGIDRQIPIRPSSNEISVRDTTSQTEIFGNLDPFCEEFVEVKQTEKDIKRINKSIKDRSMVFKSLNYIVTPMKENEESNNFAMELDKIIMDLDINSELKEDVQNIKNILDKPIVSTEKINRIQTQITEDIKMLTIHDESGLTGLHKAVMRDDSRTVKRLMMIQQMTKNDVDVRTRDNKTSLELALKMDVDPEIVNVLLEVGAQPTSQEVGYDSALLIASRTSSALLPQLMKYASKETLDSFDVDGFAAIHNCALRGNLIAVKALIAAGANIDLQDRRSGRTALFHAIENGHIDIARYLLSSGAKPSIRNNDSHTILPLLDEPKAQVLKNIVMKAMKTH